MATYISKNLIKDSYGNNCVDRTVPCQKRTASVLDQSLHSALSSIQKQEAVEYIRDMIVGLRELAEFSDQVFLAYLLDMVYEEAASAASKSEIS